MAKIIRTAPPKPHPSRPIMNFAAPARNPPPNPRPAPSNATAAHAVRQAGHPGKIDPRQRRF
jgi:hypothetical protein